MGEIYARLEKDGKLDYADVVRYNDLERMRGRINAHGVRLGTFHYQQMQKLLEESYSLSYSYMAYAIEQEASVLLGNASPNMAYLIMQVRDNPITGLHLPAAVERNRSLIVNDINSAIEEGVKNGETYGTMAKRIQKAFDVSYERALVIARTETHRVRERASYESALNGDKQGIKMDKVWRSMQDERVRHTKRADHVYMNMTRIPVEQLFQTKEGKVGPTPGNIYNSPENNIRCRCLTTYKIREVQKPTEKEQQKVTFEQWQKIKGGA